MTIVGLRVMLATIPFEAVLATTNYLVMPVTTFSTVVRVQIKCLGVMATTLTLSIT